MSKTVAMDVNEGSGEMDVAVTMVEPPMEKMKEKKRKKDRRWN